jgi:hypothetical protein
MKPRRNEEAQAHIGLSSHRKKKSQKKLSCFHIREHNEMPHCKIKRRLLIKFKSCQNYRYFYRTSFYERHNARNTLYFALMLHIFLSSCTSRYPHSSWQTRIRIACVMVMLMTHCVMAIRHNAIVLRAIVFYKNGQSVDNTTCLFLLSFALIRSYKHCDWHNVLNNLRSNQLHNGAQNPFHWNARNHSNVSH